MHMYMFGPNFWPWVIVGAVVIMLVRRRRHRRRWGWGRWEDRAGRGRRGRWSRGKEETPWWRQDPPPTDAAPGAVRGEGRDGATGDGAERGGASGDAKPASARLLPEHTLESLQREYVEGRMGVDEYEKALDALYAKRRSR